MPETRGHSLESISEQFKGHTAAQVLRDNPLMKMGKKLVSSVSRMVGGGSPTASLHSSGSDEYVGERVGGRDGIELQDLSNLAAR